jgi:hypothetical protein
VGEGGDKEGEDDEGKEATSILKSGKSMNVFRMHGDYVMGGILDSSRMDVPVHTKRRSMASWESAWDSPCLDRYFLSWICIRTTVAHASVMLVVAFVIPSTLTHHLLHLPSRFTVLSRI